MNSARPLRSVLLASLLIAAPALRAADAEIVDLAAKAEKGNAIAQYNLGLAYAEGRGVEVDRAAAFVWLTLAQQNGARGKALEDLAPKLTADELATAKLRLAALNAAPASAAPTPAIAAPAELAQAHDDKKELSAELAAAWKETELLRTERDRLQQLATTTQADATAARESGRAYQEQARIAEMRIASLTRELEQAKAAAPAAQKLAAAEAQSLRTQLAAATPAPAPAPSYPDLRGRVGDLEQQLAAARATPAPAPAPSYPDLRDRVAELERQLAAAQTPAATPAASDDTAAKLAEVEGKLTTALRGYSLLQRERDELQAKIDKTAADLTAERDTLAAKLAAAEANASAAQAEATRLGDSLGALQRSSGQSSSELAAARALIAQLQAANTTLGRENYELKAVLPRDAGRSTAAVATGRTHAVTAGDSLTKISQRYYGTPDRWPDIVAANRDVLDAKATLRVGLTLRIP